MTRDEIIALAREAQGYKPGEIDPADDCLLLTTVDVLNLAALVAAKECDRICNAIKTEDDYCVDFGDYMLDSDDCIAVAQGTWKRPDFTSEVACPSA